MPITDISRKRPELRLPEIAESTVRGSASRCERPGILAGAFLVIDADWGRSYFSCLMPEPCEAGLLSFSIVSLVGDGVLLMPEPVVAMFDLAFALFGLPT